MIEHEHLVRQLPEALHPLERLLELLGDQDQTRPCAFVEASRGLVDRPVVPEYVELPPSDVLGARLGAVGVPQDVVSTPGPNSSS